MANNNFHSVDTLQYDDDPVTAAINHRSLNCVFSVVLRWITSGTVKKKRNIWFITSSCLVTELAVFLKVAQNW